MNAKSIHLNFPPPFSRFGSGTATHAVAELKFFLWVTGVSALAFFN